MLLSFHTPVSARIADPTRSLPGLFLTLLVVIAALAFQGTARAEAPAPPTVTSTTISGASNLITVHGDGFTPGGRVQVVIVNQWGDALHEPVWTMAAPGAPFGTYGNYSGVTGYGDPGSIYLVIDLDATVVYGPYGSQDPASGFYDGVDGGSLLTLGDVQVRALDAQVGIWSHLAVVDADSSLERIHNPQIRYQAPQAYVATQS